MTARYISAVQLAERYGVNRSTIWRWTRKQRLPKPEKISEQCTRWRLDEIEKLDAKRAANVNAISVLEARPRTHEANRDA